MGSLWHCFPHMISIQRWPPHVPISQPEEAAVGGRAHLGFRVLALGRADFCGGHAADGRCCHDCHWVLRG